MRPEGRHGTKHTPDYDHYQRNHPHESAEYPFWNIPGVDGIPKVIEYGLQYQCSFGCIPELHVAQENDAVRMYMPPPQRLRHHPGMSLTLHAVTLCAGGNTLICAQIDHDVKGK